MLCHMKSTNDCLIVIKKYSKLHIRKSGRDFDINNINSAIFFHISPGLHNKAQIQTYTLWSQKKNKT